MDVLIVQPKGGLGNRIRVVFSYLLIAIEKNAKLAINWKKDRYCPAHFLDIFAPIPEVDFVKAVPLIKTSRKADVKQSHYIQTLRLLKPKNIGAIEEKVREMGERYGAVHIRRTDHVELARKNGRYVGLEYFEEFIGKWDKCFLATDCEKTQRYLMEKYPQVIVWKKIEKRRGELRQTAMEDGVADMWCCRYATEFLGTPFSSFSDTITLLRRLK